MYNANKPTDADLPSTRKLLKSTGIAVAVATGLLVTVVLPAEYGVDPTRVGSLFGLTEMGRIKVSLAAEAQAEDVAEATAAATGGSLPVATAAAPTPAGAALATPAALRSDRTVLTLAPDQGAEIKLVMQAGATARFTAAHTLRYAKELRIRERR